ncbi:tripartite tricarboxylate transporter substrate binding protein [Pusillimonas sp. ANT_WB101]|uniref:Bug family tripartite tricarboxylate transporter substrate binding protein n=1 Tax=Pusillimonas sp. ANT_WB101 TaxID=2597356 RepID=UPI0011F06383|nr:tripartite tricarboxylate transporter substrate binding protein [Pusillimonas sp. ANT_WB101]KAA0892855.1 tripartite tricarboxylate transporter substrate binding protein [Pusillimonas sp. ANT_WB101]
MIKRLICTLLISGTAAAPVFAQALPDGPLRMLVPFSAGGSTDILARLMAKEMGDILDRTIVVENKPGAEGFIAARDLKNAKPDGRTLMMVTTSVYAINPAIFSELPYSSADDFSTVAVVASSPNVFLAPANSPINSIKDLITKAAEKQENVAYATGATMHLLNAKWLESMSSTKMVSVPYKGSAAAYPDLVSGRVDFMVDQPLSSMNMIKDGKLKVLAVTSEKRWDQLPDVPTVAEQGYPDFVTSSWWALLAPNGTPDGLMKQLHDAAQTALKRKPVSDKIEQLGADVVNDSLEQGQQFAADELKKWHRIAKEANVKMN